MDTIKETLWREIESLPDSQLKTLLDYVQFLQFKRQKQTEKIVRIPGLGAGTTQVSDDFDEPLPDSFWLGDESNREVAS